MFFNEYKDFIKKKTLNYGTAVFINKKAIENNISKIQSFVGANTKVISVIKNDAYKLGVSNIAPILAKTSNSFFVATIEEAISLRKIDINYVIYVLHGPIYNRLEEFTKYNLIPVLSTLDQVYMWYMYTNKLNSKLPCALHIETGINRIGLSEEDINTIIQNYYLSKLQIEYVISHLACADIKNHPSIEIQYNNFVKLSNKIPNAKKSLCASFSIFLDKKYHFNAVRPGIALYGGNPKPYSKENIMENVIYFYTSIIQIKTIKKNDYIGYGHIWQAKQDTKIAILSIGYADGISQLSNKNGYVMIDSYKANIIGAISMDLIAIDITHIPKECINHNTIVEIVGNNITLDKYAQINNLILSDLLNSITMRYPKHFI